MLHDENKIARILFLKETVSQFLCYFSEYGEEIDNLRNLMEKETGVSDIPLEWYEKTPRVFLDLVFPNELGRPHTLDGPAIILPEE